MSWCDTARLHASEAPLDPPRTPHPPDRPATHATAALSLSEPTSHIEDHGSRMHDDSKSAMSNRCTGPSKLVRWRRRLLASEGRLCCALHHAPCTLTHSHAELLAPHTLCAPPVTRESGEVRRQRATCHVPRSRLSPSTCTLKLLASGSVRGGASQEQGQGRGVGNAHGFIASGGVFSRGEEAEEGLGQGVGERLQRLLHPPCLRPPPRLVRPGLGEEQGEGEG
eukprot:3509400-Rhodomonas_salina.3